MASNIFGRSLQRRTGRGDSSTNKAHLALLRTYSNEQKMAGYLGLPDTNAFRDWIAGPTFAPFYKFFSQARLAKAFGKNPKAGSVFSLIRENMDVLGYGRAQTDITDWTAEDCWANMIVCVINANATTGPSFWSKGITEEHNLNRVWQAILWKNKSMTASRQPKGKRVINRAAIKPACMDTSPSDDTDSNADAEDTSISPHQTADLPSGRIAWPSKFMVYWRNRDDSGSGLIRFPPKTINIPNPERFDDVRQFRDKVRYAYNLQELGCDIHRFLVSVKPRDPPNPYEDTVELEVSDHWLEIREYIKNETPDRFRWILETYPSPNGVSIYEADTAAVLDDFSEEENVSSGDPTIVDDDEVPVADTWDFDDDLDLDNIQNLKDQQAALLRWLRSSYDRLSSRVHRPSRAELERDERIAAMELTRDDSTPQGALDIEEFWKFQEARLNICCEGPDLQSSCNALGLDIRRPHIPGSYEDGDPNLSTTQSIILKRWQVTGLKWMVDAERDERKGGIVADDVGLGKTRLACALVQWTINNPTGPFHKPTLIVVPTDLIELWLEEIQENWPEIRIFLYHGTNQGVSGHIHKHIRLDINDLDELPKGRVTKKVLFMFTKTNPEASKAVILTSYETLRERSLRREPPTYDQDGNELAQLLKSIFSNRFGRVICDEAHKIKATSAKAWLAVKLLQADKKWLFTATPMINRAIDILGLIGILWRTQWEEALSDADRGLVNGEDPSFVLFRDGIGDHDPKRFMCLKPNIVRRMIENADLGELKAKMPVILRQIQLRRSYASKIISGIESYRIGEEIPAYTIRTVDLRQTMEENAEYSIYQRSLVNKLVRAVKGSDDKKRAS